MALTFTTSVAGVQAYLSTFRITDSSKPSASQVEGFLVGMESRVGMLLQAADRIPASYGSFADGAASALAELGAAAMTADAAAPEAASGPNGYGQLLWSRFYQDLKYLQDAIKAIPAADVVIPPVDPDSLSNPRVFYTEPVVGPRFRF